MWVDRAKLTVQNASVVARGLTIGEVNKEEARGNAGGGLYPRVTVGASAIYSVPEVLKDIVDDVWLLLRLVLAGKSIKLEREQTSSACKRKDPSDTSPMIKPSGVTVNHSITE